MCDSNYQNIKNMFLFTIHAVPDPAKQNTDYSDAGGAYVCCYIDFPEQKGAEVLARYYIKDGGWIDGELAEEVKRIDDIDPDDEMYQYFKEALEDGSSFVFYEYPTKDKDLDFH